MIFQNLNPLKGHVNDAHLMESPTFDPSDDVKPRRSVLPEMPDQTESEVKGKNHNAGSDSGDGTVEHAHQNDAVRVKLAFRMPVILACGAFVGFD
jgi:hypothetical protein